MKAASVSLLCAAALAQAPPPAKVAAVAPIDAAQATTCRDRALQFLVGTQHADGSWASSSIEGLLDSHYSVESYYAWQVGAHELATLALLESPASEARDAALHKAITWLTSTRLPRRGNDWDNDAVWAYLYGLVVCAAAAEHPRLSAEQRERVGTRGREFLTLLLANETQSGGWGYYDDPPYTRRPKWATSFATAAALPALRQAEQLGWLTDHKVVQRGLAYVARCALPQDAYEYDLNPVPRITGGEHINRPKGSLGRTQACNWARVKLGDEKVTPERVRAGLDLFLREHRFLDVARMRPVPHEAYYANAGYFYFFGHYYAALAAELLPVAERASYRGAIWAHVAKTQRKDGSFCDFLGQGYLIVADTAFAILALSAGLGST